MPFGRKSPLEALALPGVILAYKYSQFRQRRREAASRRITERELSALHHKIDKLLSKLEESEPDPPTSQEDECVICINARATMQTSPCGHRVVCRRCFVKTIQSAVAQRLLPLRCVICRARINRLTSNSGTWRIQESISNYSMGAKSWASVGMSTNGVIPSARSYSMNDASSGHNAFLMAHSPLTPTVPQSDSLYSMGSTGSSSANSKTSSISSELCSPGSPLSPKVNSYVQATHANIRNVVLNNHLTLPTQSISPHLLQCSTLGPNSLSANSVSPRESHHNSHYSHKSGCPTGCSGAVPRKPLNTLNTSPSGISSYNSSSCTSNGYIPHHFMVNTQTYPGRRHIKGRLVDLQNRLPPIKEFRSPAKVPHPSPVHISNPRFRYNSRYASYTKSSLACEDREPPSPPKRPMNIYVHASLNTLDLPPLKACSSKVSPFLAKHSIPKTAYINKCNNNNNNYITKKETMCSSPSVNKASNRNIVDSIKTKNSQHHQPKLSTANTPSSSSLLTASSGLASASLKTQTTKFNKETTTSLAASNGVKGIDAGGVHLDSTNPTTPHSLHSPIFNLTAAFTSRKSFPLFYNSNNKNHNRKEKLDNKKNEMVERRKEEKQKLKAEKELKKEEKRLEKEEERLAKLLAKEGKKKSKNNVRELLLPNDVNSTK